MIVCRKRKQLVSESILKDLKAKDAKRKAEIFGLKSKQQYQPKNPKGGLAFYLWVTT